MVFRALIYESGYEVNNQSNYTAAIHLFERAIQLDSLDADNSASKNVLSGAWNMELQTDSLTSSMPSFFTNDSTHLRQLNRDNI